MQAISFDTEKMTRGIESSEERVAIVAKAFAQAIKCEPDCLAVDEIALDVAAGAREDTPRFHYAVRIVKPITPRSATAGGYMHPTRVDVLKAFETKIPAKAAPSQPAWNRKERRRRERAKRRGL